LGKGELLDKELPLALQEGGRCEANNPQGGIPDFEWGQKLKPIKIPWASNKTPKNP